MALVDQVTALLTQRILDRAYAPGDRLNIDALTREFEVSSSPIREALTRLAALGLVASTSSSGFSVAPEPPRAWFEQLRDFRILNESWAARQLARTRQAEPIAAMRASVEAMEQELSRSAESDSDYIGASRLDEAFHGAMLSACGNKILARAVGNLHPHLHHAPDQQPPARHQAGARRTWSDPGGDRPGRRGRGRSGRRASSQHFLAALLRRRLAATCRRRGHGSFTAAQGGSRAGLAAGGRFVILTTDAGATAPASVERLSSRPWPGSGRWSRRE